MENSLLIIFYYGIVHALGPDHLSAITLFSIGKKKKETLVLSLLFAFGHGMTLYLLAHFIQYIASDSLLEYGDLISASVIFGMGAYLVYLALTNKIRVDQHSHNSHQHTHIYYKDSHLHDKSVLFSLGLLMGAGGVRGALVTLSVASHQTVGMEIILAFVMGVSIVFLLFGYFIYLLNRKLKYSERGLRYAVFSVGLISIFISVNNVFLETLYIYSDIR